MRILCVFFLQSCLFAFAHAADIVKQPTDVVVEPTQKNDGVGEKIYERYCITCHRDGLVGAPKFRDKDDWRTRLVGKSIDDLVAISQKGLNAMPVKGTCYECNDDDLKSAIQYMLPKS